MDNGKTSVGYMRLKEFNALARKDLVTGKSTMNNDQIDLVFTFFFFFCYC